MVKATTAPRVITMAGRRLCLAILSLIVLQPTLNAAPIDGSQNLAAAFLNILGLKEPPVVNNSRFIDVPEYVRKMASWDSELGVKGVDRELRAFVANKVVRRLKFLEVAFTLSPEQTSVLLGSHRQQLLWRWSRVDSPHVNLDLLSPVKVTVCHANGRPACLPWLRHPQRRVFAGEKENSLLIDLSKVFSRWTSKENQSRGLDLDLHLRLAMRRAGGIVTDTAHKDNIFLMLSRRVSRVHPDPMEGNDDPVTQGETRVKRRASIANHLPVRDAATTSATPESMSPGCQLVSWYLRFDDIGWGWVLQPRGYLINHCSGQCSSLGNGTDNFTNHAYLKSVYLQKAAEGQIVADPSMQPVYCVPVRLLPTSIIFMDSDYTIVHRVMTEMIAESCACL